MLYLPSVYGRHRIVGSSRHWLMPFGMLGLMAVILLVSCGGGQNTLAPNTATPTQSSLLLPAATPNEKQASTLVPLTTTTPERPTGTPQASQGLIPQNIKGLIEATRDPEWKVRWDAVNALGELGDLRAIPALVERALRDDNPHPRWRSLWAIAAIQKDGRDAMPLILAALQDNDPIVVRNGAVALAFFGCSEARPELLRALKDPDSYRRWEAVFSLREVPSSEVVAVLLTMLNPASEHEASVRSEVALTLRDIGGKEVVPDLLATLRHDPSPAVRMRASLALARLGDASLVPELEKCLSAEQDSQAREFLQNAINELKARPAQWSLKTRKEERCEL